MWARKSNRRFDEEYNYCNYWLSFRGPISVFFICFALELGAAFIGTIRLSRLDGPRSPLDVILTAISFGLIMAIASYAVQIVRKRDIASIIFHSALFCGAKTMICTTCYHVKKNDGNNRCECGGQFEDIDNWEWIEGEDETE